MGYILATLFAVMAFIAHIMGAAVLGGLSTLWGLNAGDYEGWIWIRNVAGFSIPAFLFIQSFFDYLEARARANKRGG